MYTMVEAIVENIKMATAYNNETVKMSFIHENDHCLIPNYCTSVWSQFI